MDNKRLLYIDNIRLSMIILVVIFHIAVTYSGMGSWYYQEAVPLSDPQVVFFSFFETFIQGFFMGFLFLIAGYFVPGAYDRKGFKKFIKDRAFRLGIPLLIYIFAVDPFIHYVLLGSQNPGQDFFSFWLNNITNGYFITGTGPLWFALALLIFTAIYAIVRLITKNSHASSQKKITPNAKSLAVLVLIIAAFAFTIRIWLPRGTSFFNMNLCYFAQYIVLFTMGIISYRQDLFSKLSYRMGIRRLCWAPAWGWGIWGMMMLACQIFWGSNYSLFNGGFTFQNALFALWESFTAVSMAVGLLVLFREKISSQGRFTRALSDSAFTVYVFHAPVIIWIALLFQNVQWPPVVKFLILIPICLPACFAAAYALKKIPLLKKVL